jgi:hypothetical protein
MDPTLLALLGGGGGGGGGKGGGGGLLSGLGGLVDTGFDMYSTLQQLDLARRQARDKEQQQRFGRLMTLLNTGNGMEDRLSNQNRLFALRNPGV